MKYIADIVSETGVWCHSINTIYYGALYNWYAATDVRNIANTGWHIPTAAEFSIIAVFLGGEGIAGGKLKEIGFNYWDSPNMVATNEVGFNARGAGLRLDDGSFNSLKQVMGLWSVTEIGGYAQIMEMYYNDPGVFIGDASYAGAGDEPKNNAISIRFVKDVTTLSNGDIGTYTGNDGQIYGSICIDSQEWLSENIYETKYRDGSDIPIITDGPTWGGLVTGAMCYYNNDINNAIP